MFYRTRLDGVRAPVAVADFHNFGAGVAVAEFGLFNGEKGQMCLLLQRIKHVSREEAS